MTPPGTQSPPQHPHPSAAAPGGVAPAESSLDSQIDALLANAEAPSDAVSGAGQASNANVKSAAAEAEAAVASIEKQVESLVDQFVEQASPPEGAAAVAPTTSAPEAAASPHSTASSTAAPNDLPESIGALDDQLARLTDELLTAPAPEPYQAPSVKFAPTPEDQIAPPPAEPLPQVAAPAPIAPAAASTEAPKTAATPAIVSAPAGANKLVQALAKPLLGKPRLIRDTVGWLGFNSVFLAGVVWSYHLWFQKPEKLVAQHAPAALIASDGNGESAHSEAPVEGHGTVADAHASAEHGSEAGGEHVSATKDVDEPITGVNPLHKKKPTYALSDAMAEKLNVAKKADAGHGGGGGHGAEKKSSSGHGAPPKSGH